MKGILCLPGRLVRLGIWFAVLLILFSIASGCGRKKPLQRLMSGSHEIALNDIRALERPEGAAPELFSRLKSDLERLLLERAGFSDSTFGIPQSKFEERLPSRAPTPDPGNAITLTVTAMGLKWNEARAGDWSNDGTVNANDLLPIALYFGRTDDPASPKYYEYAKYIDWDRDHIVGSGDLAPIAAHFGESTGGYSIYQAGGANGAGSLKVASISRPLVPDDMTERLILRSLATLGYDTTAGPIEPPGWQPVEGKWYQVVPVDTSSPPQESAYLSSSWVQNPLVSPVAVAMAVPSPVRLYETVAFSAVGSYDPNGTIISYQWDFESDGRYEWIGVIPAGVYYTYPKEGVYRATLRVIDNDGLSATDSVEITVGEPPLGDWLMYGRDAQHSRRSPYLGPQTGKLKWRVDLGFDPDSDASLPHSIYSSPVLGQDGTVYVGGGDQYLYAISPKNERRWRYLTGIYSPSPAVSPDGTVYVPKKDSDLYGLAALSPEGTRKWWYQTGDKPLSSPAVGTDGTIYVGSEDGYLYAMNPEGPIKWRYKTGNRNPIPAIGPDGTVYVGDSAINPDGTLKWQNENLSIQDSSPAVGPDGTIYYVNTWGQLSALNSNGQLLWSTTYKSGHFYYSPAIGKDWTLYVAGFNSLYAINFGRVLWRYEMGGQVYSSPAIGSDRTVYIGNDDGYLYAIDPTGSLKWRYNGGGGFSSPALGSDGTLYVGGKDGYLYAFSDSLQGPRLELSVSPDFGQSPLTVTFDARASTDADGSVVLYEFDFDGDGVIEEANTTGTAQCIYWWGTHHPTVTITDNDGIKAHERVTIVVGEQLSGWSHTWGGTDYEYGRRIAYDGRGNLYVTGYAAGEDDYDLFLLRYDTDGNLVWAKGLEGAMWDFGQALVVDGMGNIFVAGRSGGTITGNYDTLLTKFDPLGNLIWARRWGSDNNEEATAIGLDLTGNVILAGSAWAPASYRRNVILLKYDNQGNLQWAKTWDSPNGNAANALAIDVTGSAYVGGYAESVSPSYNVEALLLRYNSSGDLLWDKTLNLGEIGALAIEPDGDLILAGSELAKLDGAGSPIWARSLDWGSWGGPWPIGVCIDGSGKIFVSGTVTADWYSAASLRQYDAVGNLLWGGVWERFADYGGEVYPFGGNIGGSLALDSDGNVLVVGTSPNNRGLWRTVSENHEMIAVTATSANGVSNDAVGTEGIPEGFDISLSGTIDTGGGGEDILLLKLEP